MDDGYNRIGISVGNIHMMDWAQFDSQPRRFKELTWEFGLIWVGDWQEDVRAILVELTRMRMEACYSAYGPDHPNCYQPAITWSAK